MTEDEKLEWYLKLEPELSVFDISKEKIENERLKKEQTSQYKEMKEEIKSLQFQLIKQDKKILENLYQNKKLVFGT